MPSSFRVWIHTLLLSTAVASCTAVSAAQGDKPARASAPDAARTAGASAPPFPFRYLGQLKRDGLPTIVALTHEAQSYVVAAGDRFGTSYRLDDVGADHMVVTYLPLNQKQKIAFSNIRPEQAAKVAPPVVAPAPTPPPKTILGTPLPTCC